MVLVPLFRAVVALLVHTCRCDARTERRIAALETLRKTWMRRRKDFFEQSGVGAAGLNRFRSKPARV